MVVLRVVKQEYAYQETRYIVERRRWWGLWWKVAKSWRVKNGALQKGDDWDGWGSYQCDGDPHAAAVQACRDYIVKARRRLDHQPTSEVLTVPETAKHEPAGHLSHTAEPT